jgi:hypothetical protein
MKTLLSCLAVAFALTMATAPASFADDKAKTEGQTKSTTKEGCDKDKSRDS